MEFEKGKRRRKKIVKKICIEIKTLHAEKNIKIDEIFLPFSIPSILTALKILASPISYLPSDILVVKSNKFNFKNSAMERKGICVCISWI